LNGNSTKKNDGYNGFALFDDTNKKTKSGKRGRTNINDMSRVSPFSNKFFDISGTAEM